MVFLLSQLRVDSPKYTCSVVTFRPDSTGNLNVNLAIQSPVENSNQSGSNSGYKDRNTSNQSSGSQWNFSITGHSRMDHGHVWTDSVPYSGLNPAVIDRPSITGTSSSSSGGKHTDYLPRYPQVSVLKVYHTIKPLSSIRCPIHHHHRQQTDQLPAILTVTALNHTDHTIDADHTAPGQCPRDDVIN